MFRLPYFAAFMLLLLFARPVQGHSAQEHPAAAQASTPLPLNTVVTGSLTGQYASIDYAIDIPPEQDVVIKMTADKVVLDTYCVVLTTPTAQSEACPVYHRGGDGDPAWSSTSFIAWFNSPNSRQTIEMTLIRPFDPTANYQIAAYVLTPQPFTLGETNEIALADALPFQVYTFEADPTVPFSITIEDENPDGNFLWVASQPYIPGAVTAPDEDQPLAQVIDTASRRTEAGIKQMGLYYLGGRTFHLYVEATDSYLLSAAPFEVQALDANQVLPVTISYRQPLQVLRLNTDQTPFAAIHVEVVEGAGANVWTYPANVSGSPAATLGGISATSPVQFPRSATIEHATSADGLFVAVQLPYLFTRDQVTVNVEWEPENSP